MGPSRTMINLPEFPSGGVLMLVFGYTGHRPFLLLIKDIFLLLIQDKPLPLVHRSRTTSSDTTRGPEPS